MAKNVRLDRFGMFSIGPGGQIVELYLDDLQYTTYARPQIGKTLSAFIVAYGRATMTNS